MQTHYEGLCQGEKGVLYLLLPVDFQNHIIWLEHILNTIHQVQLHSVQLNLEKLQFKQTYQTDTGKG